MIELNLTYEESKKILELGYDFSKVCAVFSAKGQTMSHGLPFATMIINPFLKEVGYLENLSHLKNLPYLLLGKEIDIDSIIPLIPKAALEACLPTRLSFGTYNYGYLIYDYLHLKFHYYERRDAFYGHEKTHKSFDSVFEAFLWLHEKYPEELKAKFTKELKV